MAANPRKRRRNLTRDEGVQILAFQRLGMTYDAIAQQFNDVSSIQVENLIHKGHPTPVKPSGRPPFITDEQTEELITFICASKHNRRLPWSQLSLEYSMCTWPNATASSITSAL